MQAWGVALVVLVGAVVPLLVQARATLRSVQKVLDATGPKLALTLDEVHGATRQVREVARGLEPGGPQIAALFRAVTDLTTAVQQVTNATRRPTAPRLPRGPCQQCAVVRFFGKGNRYAARRAACNRATSFSMPSLASAKSIRAFSW